jgi:hypothetical protein
MDQQIPAKEFYTQAFESLLEKCKKDPNVIGVYLFGSLNNGDVWEKSDLDVIIIVKEEKQPFQCVVTDEQGIFTHIGVYSRYQFRRALEAVLQGTPMHFVFTQGTMVYCTDPSLQEYYESAQMIGDEDRAMYLLRSGGELVGGMSKVEKWLYFRNDPFYAQHLMLKMIDTIAGIECMLNFILGGREALLKAVELNPMLFQKIYRDVFARPATFENVKERLETLRAYFNEKAPLLFEPILDYLKEAGHFVTATELTRHFNPKMKQPLDDLSAIEACNWLVEHGIIQRMVEPYRLTTRSRVQVDEAAYYYNGVPL